MIVATTAAILFLPIEPGVGIGIGLSLLYGVWTTTRSQIVEFVRIPGTSIWWPKSAAQDGETSAGTIVIAWQAPLSFLNVYDFQRAIQPLVAARASVRLVVIEANSLVDIDYTAAEVLGAVVRRLHKQEIDVAFARLESVRAQRGLRTPGARQIDRCGPPVSERRGSRSSAGRPIPPAGGRSRSRRRHFTV